MEMLSLTKELKENAYPGRGIVLGKSEDGKKAVAAYFIMGRSENSRNRVFVEDGEGGRKKVLKNYIDVNVCIDMVCGDTKYELGSEE